MRNAIVQLLKYSNVILETNCKYPGTKRSQTKIRQGGNEWVSFMKPDQEIIIRASNVIVIDSAQERTKDEHVVVINGHETRMKVFERKAGVGIAGES